MKVINILKSSAFTLGFIAVYFITVSAFTFAGFSSVWSTIFTNVTLTPFFFEFSKKRFVFYDRDYNDKSLFVFAVFMFVLWFFSQLTSVYLLDNISDAAYSGYIISSENDAVGYLILTLFVAPVFEEVFYRGIIYRYFRDSVSRFGGYIISALIFAFMHGTFVHFPIASMGGFFFAVMYEYTGMLRVAVAYHMLFNTTSSCLAQVLRVSDTFSNPVVLVVADSMLIVVMIMLARLIHLETDKYYFVKLYNPNRDKRLYQSFAVRKKPKEI